MENTQTFDETGFLIARKAVKGGAVMLWLLAGLAALQLGSIFSSRRFMLFSEVGAPLLR